MRYSIFTIGDRKKHFSKIISLYACKLKYAPKLQANKDTDFQLANVYIYVHGKMSDKESAETFARIAENRGYKTISFDLPEHGERKSENYRCDIWNGISDLHRISSYTLSDFAPQIMTGIFPI